MKLTTTGKLLALGIAAMAFAMTGCSGGQEEDEKLEVSDEEGEAQSSAEASDSANGEGEATAQAEGEADAEPTDAVAQDTPADEVPTPDSAASVGNAGSAPVGGGMVDTGRVVRYVNAPVAPLLNAASTSAGNVGQLTKGERVMVVIEGAYARITDGMFIKVDHLSAKPVARERKDAVWQAPAH